MTKTIITPIEQPPEGYEFEKTYVIPSGIHTYARFLKNNNPDDWADVCIPHPKGSKVPVRDEWFASLVDSGESPYKYRKDYIGKPEYDSDCWQPASTMPDDAVRTWLTVKDVRVCTVWNLKWEEMHSFLGLEFTCYTLENLRDKLKDKLRISDTNYVEVATVEE